MVSIEIGTSAQNVGSLFLTKDLHAVGDIGDLLYQSRGAESGNKKRGRQVFHSLPIIEGGCTWPPLA
jgi:hypothetical protein